MCLDFESFGASSIRFKRRRDGGNRTLYTAMLRVPRRHTQILYKENRKMLCGAQKTKEKKFRREIVY
jgi:hypothetical protein